VSVLSIEEKLLSKLRKAKGVRKPTTKNIFERVMIIPPRRVWVSNYERNLISIFNPGVVKNGKNIEIFARLAFEYYKYASSLGWMVLSFDEVLEGRVRERYEVKIVMWPRYLWDFRGCEDPRVTLKDGKIMMLYTGAAYMGLEDKERFKGIRQKYSEKLMVLGDVLAYAEFDEERKPHRKGYFKIVDEDEAYLPFSNKDAAFLGGGRRDWILHRPHIGGPEDMRTRMGWNGYVDLDEMVIYADTMEVTLPLEGWETKVGWSTNAVKIGSDEYLVGWHGVLFENIEYRNGLAVVDGEGRLRGITNYVLAVSGDLQESYGDRPLSIFGDGLIKVDEMIYWFGGLCDYAIGVYRTEFDKVMEEMKWLRG